MLAKLAKVVKKLDRALSGKPSPKNGLKPKLEIFPNDVFLVSYPKSGNTWVRFLLGNYLTGGHCDFTNFYLVIPDVHFVPKASDEVRPEPPPLLFQAPRFVKSHMSYLPEYQQVIYIVRDGRDVAVSYYFHNIKYKKIDPSRTFAEFLTDFNAGTVDRFSSWGCHVNSWLDQKQDQILVVKYEDLKQNPALQLERILQFAGVESDSERVRAAVELSSFERMQNLEREQHNSYQGFAISDPQMRFMRSGTSGEAEAFFDADLMAQFIEVHRTALERLEYL